MVKGFKQCYGMLQDFKGEGMASTVFYDFVLRMLKEVESDA